LTLATLCCAVAEVGFCHLAKRERELKYGAVIRPAVAFRVDEPPWPPLHTLERHKNAAEGAGPEGRLMSSVRFGDSIELGGQWPRIVQSPRQGFPHSGWSLPGPEPTAQAEMCPKPFHLIHDSILIKQ